MSSPTLLGYWRCLQDNPHYRSLWIADFIDNIGAWLSYVAVLELVTSFSGGSGLALSAVILIRFLPSLLLSPIAGVLADRCNRINILLLAALADAGLVAALVVVRSPAQTGLLFFLLAAQFAAIALQDPARRAVVPVLVPESQLHLATTLETFSWSLTGAVGAALGGAIASKLGNASCFLIDAVTYVLAAYFASRVPRHLGDPDIMERAKRMVHHRLSMRNEAGIEEFDDIEEAKLFELEMAPLRGDVDNYQNGREDLLAGQKDNAHRADSSSGETHESLLAAAVNAWKSGVSAAREGVQYLLAADNRDVMALVTMKGCGSLTWGAVDVLNVKFSEIPSFQVGDSSTTLGLIFAVVGIGCFLGPMAMNALVPPRPRPLLWACVGSFTLLFVGSVLMAGAESLTLVLLATLVRAVGSSTLWIYSSLMLQLRCPNVILGRVCATEMALYTVSEAVSSLYGGAAFDVFHLSLRQTIVVLAVAAGVVAAGWVFYAWNWAATLPGKVAADRDDSDSERQQLVE